MPFPDSQGKVIAVARCRNKRISANAIAIASNMFSDDDARPSSVPLVKLPCPILPEGWPRKDGRASLRRLYHELKVPLVAIRNTTETILRTPDLPLTHRVKAEQVMGCTILMRRSIGNADTFRFADQNRDIRRRLTDLHRDVIEPVLHDIGRLPFGLAPDESAIEYKPVSGFGRVYVDRTLLQQAIYNIIINSVRYGHTQDRPLVIRIRGSETKHTYCLFFQDDGPGFIDGTDEGVFLQGVRGSEAMQRDVNGQGLGLWVARRAVQAHRGQLSISRLVDPTELIMRLPKRLLAHPGPAK